MERKEKLLSVVLPAHNEEENIIRIAQRIHELLDESGILHEIIFVDDGSTDGTWKRIREASGLYPPPYRVKGLRLSRGFGKDAAIYAGLCVAEGDCCAVMDSDLQHPPEKLPEMWRLWCEGYEIVEGVKASRGEESRFHGMAAKLFYQLISCAAGVDLSRSSDFKLLDRRVVQTLLDLPEREVFFRALSSWVGFRTVQVEFDVQPRAAGKSNWSSLRLMNYAVKNLTSFTAVPLYLIIVLGVLMLFAAVLLGGEAFWRWAIGEAKEGFTTVILLQLFIGSILMISLGIIGHYLSRIYDEVKHRPRYIVSETLEERKKP